MAPKKEKEQVKDIDIVDQVFAELKDKGKIYGTRAGEQIIPQDVITTSSFEFDQRLGGGFRDSGWSRFYSDPECGKTSIGLCWAKNWQDKYGEQAFVIFYNAEGRVTKEMLDRTGIDISPSRFRIIDGNKYETIFDATEKLILNNTNGRRYFFIVDSTDACERQIDAGKTFEDANKIAGGALLVSTAGKRLSLLFNVTGHHLFLSSQTRDNMNGGGMGAPSKSASGGNAPKFYSSLIGQIRKPWSETFIRENPSDKDSRIIGRMCEIRLEKTPNETTASTVFYPVKYGLKGGVWKAYEAMVIAQACSLVQKKGAWYNFESSIFEDLKSKSILDTEKYQGEVALRNAFDANPELVKYVFDKAKVFYEVKKLV